MKLGLQINCDVCEASITKQGALIFSPPKKGVCRKLHLCCKCYDIIREALETASGKDFTL